jgi:adenine/guanine phosphoribosyltransferase-like PRPP-binding protein
MLPLLEGRRVALIDDVLSTGASICAGLDVLAAAGVEPTVIGAAMLQTTRWRDALENRSRGLSERVRGVLRTPLLAAEVGGWIVATAAGSHK